MRTLIFISLFVIAGCETQLTPEPSPTPSGSALANYFWPNIDTSYQYTSGTNSVANHKISLVGDGTIYDQNQSNQQITTFSVSEVNGVYSISGFTPSDIFGFDGSTHIVSDTTQSPPHNEPIRSIAAMNPFGPSTLFAASDSVLYQINLQSNTLTRLSLLPASGLTLAEDINEQRLFAYQKGGTEMFWTSDNGAHWSQPYNAPSGITAFASANTEGGRTTNLFWAACGSSLFLFTNNSQAATQVNCPVSNVIAMESNPSGASDVIIAGSGGQIFEVTSSGTATQWGATLNGTTINGLAWDYVSTSSGIFDYTKNAPSIIVESDVAIYYSTVYSIFASRNDGSIDHFSIFEPTDTLRIPAPVPGTPVSQFAYPVPPSSGIHSADSGVCALVGSQVYYRQNASTWVPINQTVVPPPSFPQGAFIMLDTGSTWIAGYLESANGPAKGYSYIATKSGPFASIKVNNQTYSNVLVVNYTSQSHGLPDTQNIPQYTIYFAENRGPVAFERSVSGSQPSILQVPQ